MTSRTQAAESSLTTGISSRIIGRIDGAAEGPTIFVFAGMHGNEPAGIKALDNVCTALKGIEDRFRGTFIGIRANLRALYEGVRYVDEDMNRIWFPSIIDKVRRCPVEELDSSERMEIKKLLELIDRELSDKPGQPVIFVDLHSFSSHGGMFAITARNDSHIDLVSSLHVPLVFGIDEALPGTALRYFQTFDYMAFAFEGGNHQSRITIENKTAALMLLVCNAGNVHASDIPEYRKYDRHLIQQTEHLPSRVELVYQHIIEPGDEFEMRPGFKNFQPVKKGEWLANDKNGKIRAQSSGFILMPLYQKQGDDGFFIVREQA